MKCCVIRYVRSGRRPSENSPTFSHGRISFAFRALRPSRDEEIMEIFAPAAGREILRSFDTASAVKAISRSRWNDGYDESSGQTPISPSPTHATFGQAGAGGPRRRKGDRTTSFALGHFSLGVAHLFSGRASEAITPFRRGLRLSPYDPQNPVWSNFLAVAQFFAGDAEGALATSAHALGARPDRRPIIETVACCYAATGKWDDAVGASSK